MTKKAKPTPENTPPPIPPEREELLRLAAAASELERRKRENALSFYRPYGKQREFHALGKTVHERALIAANRTGKTYCAAAEVAMHLTGIYPDDWPGRKFDEPVRCWAAGVTGIATRDIVQKDLFGKPGVEADRGTGMVPKSCVDWGKGTSLAHGYAYLFDTVHVKHRSGGTSSVTFKTYEQARERWQGEALHVLW